MLERLRHILFNPSGGHQSYTFPEEMAITKPRPRHKKKLSHREKELSEKALELKELEVALRFTALNSKLTVMEHYQQPRGVNYR